MAKLLNYIKEIKQARKITQSIRDFLKLIFFTVLYHLGNKWQIFNSNNDRRIHCLCNGRKINVEFRQNSGDIFTLYEILARFPYRFPYQSLGRVNTIVDLGAHIGLASLYFAILFPKSRLLSVEPVPDNFKLLKKNCEMNGVYPTLKNNCIGTEKGTARIHLNASSNRHSLFGGVSRAEVDSSIEVGMITMNDLITENGINEIDILKVDIEGEEIELFSEYKSWMSKVRSIIIEIHPTAEVGYKEFIDTVTSYGFCYFRQSFFHQDVFLREDVANKMKEMNAL